MSEPPPLISGYGIAIARTKAARHDGRTQFSVVLAIPSLIRYCVGLEEISGAVADDETAENHRLAIDKALH